MAAIKRKPFLEKIMEAINAGGERMENEAEQFGYSYAKNSAESREESGKRSAEREEKK
ncbi:MAG: hypothetical protein IJ508_01580 [Oscillospiraceae bacterium]|nr:hypothetical protein [Oscillospiraceae bacterium]MBQ8917178.1 hypothetical protein [Oscillospiraceae bacterium]